MRVIAREKRTTDDLIAALDRGIPCWSAFRRGARTDTTPKTRATRIRIWQRDTGSSGVGYQKKSDGNVFYFNDPACVGYGLMREADFNRRWIDMDAAGTIYDHYGIEIAESGSAYDPQGVFELE